MTLSKLGLYNLFIVPQSLIQLPSLIILTIITGLILYVVIVIKNKARSLEERNKRLIVLRKLDEVMMSSTTNLREVAQKVTDAMAFELGFENGVLALIDRKEGVLKRIAMSNTPHGIKAKESLSFPYEELKIPLSASENVSIQAITTGQVKVTHDLYDVFMPVLTRELSNKLQQTVGVTTSMNYPIRAKGVVIGVMIVSIAREPDQLFSYEKASIAELFDVIGIALNNAMLYENLDSVSKQLAHANTRLQELDKLKDDFVSIASHELRTPMTAIRSYAWMALNKPDIPLSEKMKKWLDRTLTSTERLINLVNDMLNISRIEGGRIEVNPIALAMTKLVDDVLEEVRVKAAEKQLNITAKAEGVIPKVFADPDKVHQILLNLLGNAMKFTPNGGIITVSFFTDGQMVEVAVKDSGVGLSKESISKLFQKFGRLDSSYTAVSTSGGTGLGLYISKSLVELMKGRIWVSSEGLNRGSTFAFSLPVASAEVVKEAEKYSVKVNGGEAKPLEPVAI